jgi:peptidoglycan hydrolase-like protein with peptidoglycan-binding domain
MRLSGPDLRAGMAGAQVADLHAELLQLGLAVPEAERGARVFGVGTAQAVASFQKAHGLRDTAVVDQNTAAALGLAAEVAGEKTVLSPPSGPRSDPPRRLPPNGGTPSDQPPSGQTPGPAPVLTSDDATVITGQVHLEYGVPAADVTIRAYQRGFGGAATLVGETATRADGSYRLTYSAVGESVNLELRTVLPRKSDNDPPIEVSLTNTVFGVTSGDVLNLVAPATVRPLRSEYARLLADAEPHLGGLRLGAARQTDDQPDLTLLQENTGWDARLVALAASADHVTATTGLAPAAAYALLRAGMPADAVGLAGVAAPAVDRALRAAVTAGVVDLDAAGREAAVASFTAFARTTRLAAVAPGALSSQGEMLAAAGLSDAEAARFDEIHASAQRNDGSAHLWSAAAEAGLPVDALRRTGKLGYLTLNNATLTRRLLPDLAGSDLGPALVSRHLHRPQAWVRQLTETAGGDDETLAALVPPAYAGATTQAKVRAYAEDMARKVRIGYPTNVVATLVAAGQLPLSDADDGVQVGVATFLDRAAGLGLSLGRDSVSAMLREHGDRLLAGVPADRVEAVTGTVKTLHRIYQITPTDEAMAVLLALGFRSAYDVTAMAPEKFLRRHGERFTDPAQARLVYAKAQQVSSTTLATFTAARQFDVSPPVFALAGTPEAHESAKASLVTRFPTMEQLFGSLDYCACDHCRSVLSPAAYLVDLLHFLDPPADQWQVDLAQWQTDHDAPYPHADAQAWLDFQAQWAVDHPSEPVPDGRLSPFQVLTRRRPDLARLPLTCENTHTAMPCLDVVNEILEYYVVHGRLTADAVRDTGAAQTADLLAEPQYLIPEAYTVLRDASYPLALPFDLWLETVRRLLEYFETPLWQVLDAFRRTDALYATGPAPYGQATVAIERLGLSAAEYAVMADPDPVPHWHVRYGYPRAAEAQALTELSNAKNLARRLGVSYQELLDLMTTGFVNPLLARVAALPKLGLGISDVLRYQGAPGHAPFSPAERAAFEAALAPVGGTAALGDLWDADDLGQMLVLADPSGDCGFDTTTVRYADGTPADPVAFLTLSYLVRLWRRLGWSLTETDRALQVFLPIDPTPRTGTALGTAMGSALLGLGRLAALHSYLGGTRAELLELWSDLTAARYAELFLVPGTPTIDPVFDQPLGRYLEYLDGATYRPYTWDPGQDESAVDGNVGLVNHVGTVQAALGLTAEDVAAVLTDAGTTLAAAPLDLATVSVLHRYAVLARRLRLPVADLIALRHLAGVDPFGPPTPQPVSAAADDRAQTTVRFAETVLAVREAGIAVTDVDYLLRHRYDPAGPFSTVAAPPLGLVRSLDAEITRIRTEHADPTDPTALSDDELRQKMALVLASDTVDRFFGMWTGTITYDAVATGVAEADQLDPAAVAGESAVSVSYDPVREEQYLTYRAVPIAAELDRLIADHPGPADATGRYADLLASVLGTATDFFNANLVAPVGFLDATDYDEFFTPLPAGTDEAARQAKLDADRARLIMTFLPYLRDRLIDQAVLSTVGAEFPDDPVLVSALLTEPDLLTDRVWPGEALLSAYRAAGDRGLTVAADPAAQTASVDTYLEVAVAGTYRFAVSCAVGGTAVDVRFDHLSDALLLATTVVDGEEPGAFVDLSPGTMYHLRLDASATSGGAVAVLVQGLNLPKGPVDRLACHPADAVERVRRAHVLLDKSVRLAAVAELTEPELRHLLTHRYDFAGLSLGALPVTATEDVPTSATVLFGQLLRLFDHAALRREMGAGSGALTDLFAHARRTYATDIGPDGAVTDLLTDLYARVAVLTRRDELTVAEAAGQLGVAGSAVPAGDLIEATVPALVNEVGLGRLWRLLAMSGRLGVTPGVLASVATPTPSMPVARQLRDAVRAGCDVTAWRRVAQPVFNVLRQRRRDALVAWIMHADGFDRLEQLFEYFLVDPGTEPVVQTSRLRLAISAVQLFIQRCLLNLEPQVGSSMINSGYWQWMKRYRVWEANRKIFLWPENWLEPEFRDDKTHLFQALESSLFSGDVTDDLAEEAFFGYLRSLETLARLDIRALYIEEQSEPARNTLHVVGRTFGAPYAYFYRSYAYGMWTPWIPVTAEIEGNHLVAAVWRDRPHLFWVTFVERPESTAPTKSIEVLATKTVDELRGPRLVDAYLHWTEYYQGAWTDPAAVGLTTPVGTEVRDPEWRPAAERLHVSHDGDALLVHLSGRINQAFRIESKNSPPVAGDFAEPPEVPFWTDADGVDNNGWGPLHGYYVDRITTTGAGPPEENLVLHPIFEDAVGWSYTLRVAGNLPAATDQETAALVSPLFYQDRRNTFFIEPTLVETTLDQYDGWVIPSVTAYVEFDRDIYWDRLELLNQAPVGGADASAVELAPDSRYELQALTDWVTRPESTVRYGGVEVVGHSTGTTTGGTP